MIGVDFQRLSHALLQIVWKFTLSRISDWFDGVACAST